MHTLNTNSRYLSSDLSEYVQELVATLPEPLQVAYFVNSGSEANDLALRLAHTLRPDATHVVVMGGAYHGHLTSLIPLSSYKFWGPGGGGKEPWVHVMPCPDPYRGHHLHGAAVARAAIAEAHRAGGRVGAFICESILSCGGQIVLPPGYLAGVYHEMRKEGALCIADEVQCGFGRVGDTMWAFETQGVVPDVVTMGKPIGNGFPLAALVTTPAAAHGFTNGMEYFNTFGGCNAAMAAGRAVLRVIKKERLQQHAKDVGEYLQAQLKQLKADFPFLGDVRGLGLFVGVEIVRDPITKMHAPVLAKWIKDACKARHVLVSSDGPYDNVIKMKPPMVFNRQNADEVVATLRSILTQDLTPQKKSELDVLEQAHFIQVVQPRMALYKANEVAVLGSSSTADIGSSSSTKHGGSRSVYDGAVVAVAAAASAPSCRL
eukprot:jgi/Chrzof1/5854/Cz16g18070.t1